MPVNKNWKQVMISELSKNNQSERQNKLLLTLTFCAPKNGKSNNNICKIDFKSDKTVAMLCWLCC